jgi:hypothetical protein
MWAKTTGGDYLNLGAVFVLYAAETTSNSGVWAIVAPGAYRLAGEYSSQAEAQEAIQKLVHGFDPAP